MRKLQDKVLDCRREGSSESLENPLQKLRHIVVVRDPERASSRPAFSSTEVDSALDRAFEGAFNRPGGANAGAKPAATGRPGGDSGGNWPALRAVEPAGDTTVGADGPPITDDIDDEWYLSVDGHQFGPMSFDELASRVKRGEARGEAGDEAFVWRDGFDDWIEVGNVPELRPYAPPPLPPRGRSGLYPATAVDQFEFGAQPVVAPGVSGAQIPVSVPPSGRIAIAPAPTPAGGVPLAGTPQAGVPAAALRVDTSLPGAVPAPAPAPVADPASSALYPVAAPPQRSENSWTFPLLIALLIFFGGAGFLIWAMTKDNSSTQIAAQSAPPPVAERIPTVESVPEVEPTPETKEPIVVTSDVAEPVEREIGRTASRRTPRTKNVKPRAPTKEELRLAELRKRWGGGDGPSALPTNVGKSRTAEKRRSRNISPSEIQREFGRSKKAVTACYQRALKRDNSLTNVKANVTVTVDSRGRVSRVRITGTRNATLVSCLKGTLKRMSFSPAPGRGAAELKIPLNFRGS